MGQAMFHIYDGYFIFSGEQCIDLEQGDIRFDIFQSLRFDAFVFN